MCRHLIGINQLVWPALGYTKAKKRLHTFNLIIDMSERNLMSEPNFKEESQKLLTSALTNMQDDDIFYSLEELPINRISLIHIMTHQLLYPDEFEKMLGNISVV
jgi:hypothetical protein